MLQVQKAVHVLHFRLKAMRKAKQKMQRIALKQFLGQFAAF
jgi:hypothetical protein